MSNGLYNNQRSLLSIVSTYSCPDFKPKSFSVANTCILFRGWSIYSAAFGIQTPCFTVPLFPVALSTSSLQQRAATATSVVDDKIFTIKYSLAKQHKGGLSKGAKAGIGVGVALGILLLLGLAVFAIIRRRRGRNELTRETPEVSELPANGMNGGAPLDRDKEFSSNGGSPPGAEMLGPHWHHEMPTPVDHQNTLAYRDDYKDRNNAGHPDGAELNRNYNPHEAP